MNRGRLVGLLVLALLSGAVNFAQADVGVCETQARPGAGKSHPLRYDNGLINRWGLSAGGSSYAGTYYSPRHGGVLVVGFTDQAASNMAKVRALPGILEPERLVPRRGLARYSLRSLRHLEARLIQVVVQAPGSGHLIISWRVNLKGNLLRVTSGRVQTAREVLRSKFGKNAPIVVRFGERKILT